MSKPGPSLSSTAVSYEEGTAMGRWGAKLFLRRWQPGQGAPRGEVFLIHGYAEHSGRYRKMAHRLTRLGLTVIGFDLRGHGRSSGPRGHVQSFEAYLDDLEAVMFRPHRERSSGGRFLLGHSLGGLIALDFATSRGFSVDGVVVTNPFLALRRPKSTLVKQIAKRAARWCPTLRIPHGLAPEDLSRDHRAVRAYRLDPLVFKTATPGWFEEVRRAQNRVSAQTSVPAPLLYIYSDADPIACPDASQKLSRTLAGSNTTVWRKKELRHEVLNEIEGPDLHSDIGHWLLTQCTP